MFLLFKMFLYLGLFNLVKVIEMLIYKKHIILQIVITIYIPTVSAFMIVI